MDEKTVKKTIELVITGFLKRGEYSAHYSKQAVRLSRKFARKHADILAQAEKDFGVEKEAIVSLIWVETKFGRVTGTQRVLDSFFAIFQADHPSRIADVKAAIQAAYPDATDEDFKKAVERASQKSAWALEELQALQTLHKQGWVDARALKGSFAGAFGLPQFLPSSVLKYAKSPDALRSPAALFEPEVAIYSVASYLSINGWKNGPEYSKERTDALFHYNRATGYGLVILQIAEELKSPASSSDEDSAS
jgi:membrane-bound lytic murein transglycosylase B